MKMKILWTGGTPAALATVLAPIAWGTTYITITEFLPDDRPLFVAAGRVVPAGLVLIAIGVLNNRTGLRTLNWRQLATLALFNFGIFFPLLIAAIYRLPGGVAASVGGLQPLLVALGGYVLVGITPKRRDLGVGAIAAIGVAMVVIRPAAQIDPGENVSAPGSKPATSSNRTSRAVSPFAASAAMAFRAGVQVFSKSTNTPSLSNSTPAIASVMVCFT